MSDSTPGPWRLTSRTSCSSCARYWLRSDRSASRRSSGRYAGGAQSSRRFPVATAARIASRSAGLTSSGAETSRDGTSSPPSRPRAIRETSSNGFGARATSAFASVGSGAWGGSTRTAFSVRRSATSSSRGGSGAWNVLRQRGTDPTRRGGAASGGGASSYSTCSSRVDAGACEPPSPGSAASPARPASGPRIIGRAASTPRRAPALGHRCHAGPLHPAGLEKTLRLPWRTLAKPTLHDLPTRTGRHM